MKKITHDGFFKEVFTKKAMAKGFLEAFLPEQVLAHLDLDSLKLSEHGFVDKDMNSAFSDLLYQVRTDRGEGFVYLLAEHKSRPDRMVAFQLLRYMVRVWEQYLKQHSHAKQLPVVIPMVIYAGRTRWRVSTTFRDLFEPPDQEFLRFIPEFDLPVYDLGQVPDRDLAGIEPTGPHLLGMKHAWDANSAIRAMDMVMDHEGARMDRDTLYSLALYLVSAARVRKESETDFGNMVRKLVQFFGGDDMDRQQGTYTLAEKWFGDGLEKGREEGIKAMLSDLLELRYGVAGLDLVKALDSVHDLDTLQAVRMAVKAGEPIEHVHAIIEKIAG